MAYEVSTPVYQGPFDLLLHLILSEQVEIWDVDLSAIVDAYLVELERMESVDLELATKSINAQIELLDMRVGAVDRRMEQQAAK